MTEDIHKLDARVSVLESRDRDTRELLKVIESKIDALGTKIHSAPACPAPGSCTTLAREVHLMQEQLTHHATEIEKLTRWQTYVFGACGAIVVGWTVGITLLRIFAK